MKVRPWLGVVALVLVLAACSDSDDGAEIRSPDSAAGSASGSGGTSGSASGSASGIDIDDVAGDTDDPLIQAAVAGYQTYVADQVDTMLADTTTFTDAVRAGDIDAAKAAYAQSRQAW
jgi:iron uptake system component EfeO